MGSNPVSLNGGAFRGAGFLKAPVLFMDTILLASASPRRKELLESHGFPVLVRPVDTDETLRDSLPVRSRVRQLAWDKAEAALSAARDGDPRWILAADTLVALGNRVLGKPGNRDRAREYLRLLSGRTHIVATGLAFSDRLSGRSWKATSVTKVRFARLSEADIGDYLESDEWRGAAGAYRIQDRAAFLVERISGSYTCVVGLPLRTFYVILRQSGYRTR